jgi:hypothetical protein
MRAKKQNEEALSETQMKGFVFEDWAFGEVFVGLLSNASRATRQEGSGGGCSFHLRVLVSNE